MKISSVFINFIFLFINFFIHGMEDFSVIFGKNNDLKCIGFKKMVNFRQYMLVSNNFPFFSLLFHNFYSFEQLYFDCLANKRFYLLDITFIPNKKIVLKNNNRQTIKFYVANGSQLSIHFVHINGIDLNFNMFKIELVSKDNSIIFSFSNFYLFNNGSKINFCDANFSQTPFQNVQFLYFSSSVKYSEYTCPLIFNNTKLDSVIFDGLCETFLRINKLSFFSNLNVSFTAKIESALFILYNFRLQKNLINEYIFDNTSFIRLEGTLKSLDIEPFVELHNLKLLQIFLKNLNVLISNNSTWLNKIVGNFKTEFSFMNNYLFPDEDLCIFKAFKNTINVVKSDEICSCTIIYLWSETKSIKNLPENCQIVQQKCNFTQLLSNCQKPVTSKYKEDLFDFYYKTEMISLFNLILLPFFCLLSLMTNALSILFLISGRRMAKMTDQTCSNYLTKLMLINSSLNFIYSFIYLFHMSNICIFYDGIFCSGVKKTILFQVIEKYLVEFIGNSIKTASNIIYVLVAKCRLKLLIGKKNLNQRSKKFINAIILILICILINLESIFTIEINDLKSLNKNDYSDFPIKNTFINVLKRSAQESYLGLANLNRDFDPIYFGLYFLKFFVNDILLYSLNLVIDCLLIYRLKKLFDYKKIESTIQISKRKIHEKKRREFRTTFIIIFNSFILLILRLFELITCLVVFYFIIYTKICHISNKICTNIYNLGSLFYLISCSLNIIIFFYLNFEFHNAAKNFLNLIKKIICNFFCIV